MRWEWRCGGAVAVLLALGAVGGCGGDGEGPEAVGEAVVEPAPGEEHAQAAGAGPAFRLRAEIDPRRGQVEGSLEGVGFEAGAEGETGARARFWWEGEEDSALAVAIEGPAAGSMEWKGVRLDGYGALSAAEEEALVDLEQALPATTVARIALDLACREGAEELSPAVGAALLMPTQMALKYRTPSSHLAEAIARMAHQSECQYLRGPLDTIDPERAPAPGVVALSGESPLPMAAGYFPFDGEGQR